MVKLGELLRQIEERKREQDTRLEEATLTVYDAAVSPFNASLLCEELPHGIICPFSVEGCNEIVAMVERGEVVRVKVRKMLSRVMEVLSVETVPREEIEVDGEFQVRPSYRGYMLWADGNSVFVPLTVNGERLYRLYAEGHDRVIAKLVGKHEANGRLRCLGIWVIPVPAETETGGESREEGEGEAKPEEQPKPEEHEKGQRAGEEQEKRERAEKLLDEILGAIREFLGEDCAGAEDIAIWLSHKIEGLSENKALVLVEKFKRKGYLKDRGDGTLCLAGE